MASIIAAETSASTLLERAPAGYDSAALPAYVQLVMGVIIGRFPSYGSTAFPSKPVLYLQSLCGFDYLGAFSSGPPAKKVRCPDCSFGDAFPSRRGAPDACVP